MPKTVPQEGRDDWKTFVADAAAKDPSERTEAEKQALRAAFFGECNDPPVEGSEERMTFVVEAAAKDPSKRTDVEKQALRKAFPTETRIRQLRSFSGRPARLEGADQCCRRLDASSQ
jgi:hypothetical protein